MCNLFSINELRGLSPVVGRSELFSSGLFEGSECLHVEFHGFVEGVAVVLGQFLALEEKLIHAGVDRSQVQGFRRFVVEEVLESDVQCCGQFFGLGRGVDKAEAFVECDAALADAGECGEFALGETLAGSDALQDRFWILGVLTTPFFFVHSRLRLWGLVHSLKESYRKLLH